MAETRQSHAALVELERRLERHVALLELLDDGLELRDGGLEAALLESVLAAQEDVAVVGVHRAGGDLDSLEDRMRVALEDDAVLEAAGLRLVGVGDDVARAGRLVLGRDRAPF